MFPQKLAATGLNRLGKSARSLLFARQHGVKKWASHLKLSQKIGCGYALTLGFAILGVTAGFVVGDRYEYKAQLEKEDAAAELDLANRLKISMLAMGIEQKDSILTLQESSTWKQEYENFRSEKANFQRIWQEFKSSQAELSDVIEEAEGEEKIIKELIENHDVFMKDLQYLETLFQKNSENQISNKNLQELQTEAISFHNKVLLGDISRFVNQLSLFTDQAVQETVEAKEDLILAEQIRGRIIIVSLAVSSILSALLALLVSRAIVIPIRAIADFSQHVISTADFSLQSVVNSKDEVSQLAISINQLISTVGTLLQEQEGKNTSLERALCEIQSTQAILIQSEKMSSLGQMVAGVAHEINNPVNFIHGNLFYLQKYLTDIISGLKIYQENTASLSTQIQKEIDDLELDYISEDASKILTSMQVGTHRITEIVLSLRNFSRLDEAEVKSADIHEGIDNTLMILGHRLKASATSPEVKIVKNYADIPSVQCYAGQLNQVFMNILSNAIDAFEEGNQTRTYGEIKENPNEIYIQTEVTSNRQVCIRIKDNGTGIPQTVLDRIFDPFFTTKEVGKGTGLGLAISYKVVVEKHGGQLSCHSQVGQGTEFMIQIPMTQPEFKIIKA